MKLKRFKGSIVSMGLAALIFGAAGSASAEFQYQCPRVGGANNTGISNGIELVDGVIPDNEAWNLRMNNKVCMHVTGSDGFATMADGKRLYVFGFKDQTGVIHKNHLNRNSNFHKNELLKEMGEAVTQGILGANQPSPPISLNQDDDFFLTLTNPGMVLRPDLFDPHTVHYHGFPEASAQFDGVPETSISINQAASITYWYNNAEPGTFMWHCHVEATEHMQMGMLGSLHVNPAQNKTGFGGNDATIAQLAGGAGPKGYVYNDGDGTTAFDVEKTILLGGYDGVFHDASEGVLPLPFAEMEDNYPTINGRGYPDTVGTTDAVMTDFGDWQDFGTLNAPEQFRNTQPVNAIVSATAGERVLLRLTNLNVSRAFTIQLSGGLKMKLVGQDARINRGRGLTDGKDLYHETSSIRVNGGSTHDLIIDTTGFAAGDYVLYTTNTNYLSNDQEDFGGIMTTITIN